jgi:hypothetical protein
MDDKLHPMNEKYPFALRNHANVVSWQNLYFFWLNLDLSTKHFYLLAKLLPPDNSFISFRLNLYLSTKPFYILGKPLYFIVKPLLL